MPVYLKKAAKAATTNQDGVRATVAEIIDSIRERGETAVREYAAKFDNWKRDFILPADEIQQLIATVPQQVKDDTLRQGFLRCLLCHENWKTS